MPDSSDAAQAHVFAEMLTAEITSMSSRIEASEKYARKASRVGDSRSSMWHTDEARAQKKALYELHRQLDALRTRFVVSQSEPTPMR
ncbi:hypothetical protein HQO84_02220 [Rhodococcus fascians]|nr:hypothetical protein [Rhodococcus fascians]MBY3995091.1 hypothetical protein [Rhodococcus fascians]MBY4000589.1 hypothetical protein [Rhodococcus fascians]MBY4005617.1 hypothetical protein [Rhodococcus fascians]MBY4016450.1 hypothetical protein [Rhodococcus fascians]